MQTSKLLLALSLVTVGVSGFAWLSNAQEEVSESSESASQDAQETPAETEVIDDLLGGRPAPEGVAPEGQVAVVCDSEPQHLPSPEWLVSEEIQSFQDGDLLLSRAGHIWMDSEDSLALPIFIFAGENPGNPESAMTLLPNRALESVLSSIEEAPFVRVIASGTVQVYRGHAYLLLTVARVEDYSETAPEL